MLKLYKFRSLGPGAKGDEEKDTPLGRAKTILETGEFWCASLWEMNDPMEGIFSFDPGNVPQHVLDDVFHSKNHRRICCFSGEEGFKQPTMWGYYANGFKGIAIEVSVDEECVSKVRYSKDLAKWVTKGKNVTPEDMVHRILTTKLNKWRHENEYRFIRESDWDGLEKIGKITAVHLGWPYQHIVNDHQIVANSPSLQNYRTRALELAKFATSLGKLCFGARLEGTTVVTEPFADIPEV